MIPGHLNRWIHRAPLLVIVGILPTVPGAQENNEQISKREAEKSYTVTLEAKRQSLMCFPSTSVEYQQANTLAQISGVVSIDDCGAASGEYRVSLVIRDDEGNSETLQFEESWSRADAEPVVIEKEYSIGESVDLLRVRIRSKSCRCAEESRGSEDAR